MKMYCISTDYSPAWRHEHYLLMNLLHFFFEYLCIVIAIIMQDCGGDLCGKHHTGGTSTKFSYGVVLPVPVHWGSSCWH